MSAASSGSASPRKPAMPVDLTTPRGGLIRFGGGAPLALIAGP
jgi:hypothetical protein